jgi:ferredoxin-type protein NapH
MKPGFLSRTLTGVAVMLGRKPRKPGPGELTPAMTVMAALKKTPEDRERRRAYLMAEKAAALPASNTWRYRRWVSILVMNGLFVASYWLDLQLIEGALTASRVLGFHFADLNSSLQLMLAHGHVVINLVIGISTVLALYMLAGGRVFCSWVCPYHLLSELAEMLHLKLADRMLVEDHALDRRLRTVLFVVFAGLAFASGYTLFETISPVGILSRALTYGTVIGLIWVVLLLLVEIFWSRRFWCRYVCPIGLTYGMAGTVAPVRIVHVAGNCYHEGRCRQVCLVPHVLEMTKLGFGREVITPIGPDCTRCAMCIDVCPSGALRFDIKGLTRPPETAG